MGKRHRQHINPLKMTALVPREVPLELPTDARLEVELGCGDARFIISRALLHPDRLFVGLDIRDLFLQDAHELAEELAGATPDNLTLAEANFIVDAGRLFQRGRVARFYINFPDPWFKRRQHNRRWLTMRTLNHLVRALARDGEIFFQSDVWDVSLEALGLLELHPGLHNKHGPWTFHKTGNPYGVSSSRELVCQDEGLKIWRMLFTRVG